MLATIESLSFQVLLESELRTKAIIGQSEDSHSTQVIAYAILVVLIIEPTTVNMF